MEPLARPALSDIQAAVNRLRGVVTRTPLLPLDVPESQARIHLKLEILQPIGSFKIRGSGNAMLVAGAEALRGGVWTASAGNMAQGVAWHARRMGIPCRVLVPDNAPAAKTDAVARLGGEVIRVPFDAWWRALVERGYPGLEGTFIHPVADPLVIAGNGTIGLEILEDLPEADTLLVPFGGGGLISGIASAAKALNPRVRILACEVETAAPLTASFAAGKPMSVDRRPSFVDGIGGSSVLPEMWPLVRELVDDTIVVSLDETTRAMRFLADRMRVITEGAGAVPVAAALSGWAGSGTIACVVSGGNIDLGTLAQLLVG